MKTESRQIWILAISILFLAGKVGVSQVPTVESLIHAATANCESQRSYDVVFEMHETVTPVEQTDDSIDENQLKEFRVTSRIIFDGSRSEFFCLTRRETLHELRDGVPMSHALVYCFSDETLVRWGTLFPERSPKKMGLDQALTEASVPLVPFSPFGRFPVVASDGKGMDTRLEKTWNAWTDGTVKSMDNNRYVIKKRFPENRKGFHQITIDSAALVPLQVETYSEIDNTAKLIYSQRCEYSVHDEVYWLRNLQCAYPSTVFKYEAKHEAKVKFHWHVMNNDVQMPDINKLADGVVTVDDLLKMPEKSEKGIP